MARPKSQNRSVHTAIRLPAHIHEEIASAAEESTMAQEIKRRLDFSLRLDRLDGDSTFLVHQLLELFEVMKATGAPWNTSPYLRDVLLSVMGLLLRAKVPGEAKELSNVPRGATVWLKAQAGAEESAKNLLDFHLTLRSLQRKTSVIEQPVVVISNRRKKSKEVQK